MTTNTLLIIGVLLFGHWFADFVMQTHKMATNKSKSNYWLTLHVGVYTAIITLFFWVVFYNSKEGLSLFAVAVLAVYLFGTHWITDYFSSRVSSKLFSKALSAYDLKRPEMMGAHLHNFFEVIGLDQFVHHATILLGIYIAVEYLL